jgi:hypothetical protein
MGKARRGTGSRGFVGVSEGTEDSPATLEEALASAAAEAVRAKVVTKRRTVRYDVVRMEVEIANQHVRTYRVVLTPYS